MWVGLGGGVGSFVPFLSHEAHTRLAFLEMADAMEEGGFSRWTAGSRANHAKPKESKFWRKQASEMMSKGAGIRQNACPAGNIAHLGTPLVDVFREDSFILTRANCSSVRKGDMGTSKLCPVLSNISQARDLPELLRLVPAAETADVEAEVAGPTFSVGLWLKDVEGGHNLPAFPLEKPLRWACNLLSSLF